MMLTFGGCEVRRADVLQELEFSEETVESTAENGDMTVENGEVVETRGEVSTDVSMETQTFEIEELQELEQEESQDQAEPDVETQKQVPEPEMERIETAEVTLVMVGDMLMHTQVNESGVMEDGSIDFSHLFTHTRELIEGADLCTGKSGGYSGRSGIWHFRVSGV